MTIASNDLDTLSRDYVTLAYAIERHVEGSSMPISGRTM